VQISHDPRHHLFQAFCHRAGCRPRSLGYQEE